MQGLQPELLSDLPDDTYSKIRQLEDSFSISTPGLKILTNHFIKEFAKGLTARGGDIPMNVTWVMGYPTGEEQGQYLTLDMGGTNLRVCDVILQGRDKGFKVIQSKYKLPEKLRNGTAEDLWDFVAECVRLFLQEHRPDCPTSERLPLAFTFSYPVTQNSVKNGILQQWTKAFSVPDVEGCDVVPQLQDAFGRKQLPVDIVALVNDTTGTLIASAYCDPEIKIGSIISTGCNAAYMEDYGSIAKIEECDLTDESLIAINTECGAYGHKRHILPRTSYDETLDKLTPHPGAQPYEKMVAGLYLGELLRLTLLEMHYQNSVFKGEDMSLLHKQNIIDTSFLTAAEEDMSRSLERIRELFMEKIGIEPKPHELRIIRYMVEMIGTRAARLYACSIAAICMKKGIDRCHVGVDGAVFQHYTRFRSRTSQALREILDWPHDSEDLITFHRAEDGSSVGAALIAALAIDRSGSGRLKPKEESE